MVASKKDGSLKVAMGVWAVVVIAALAMVLAAAVGWLLPALESASVDLRMKWRYLLRPEALSGAHPDIALVEIEESTVRRIGRWGAGSWITRRPFQDQLLFFQKYLSPTVLAYDIVFQEAMGSGVGSEKRITESPERIDRIIRELETVKDRADQLLNMSFLDDINRLTLEQGNAVLAIRCADVADADVFKLLMGYYFRGGAVAQAGTRVDEWSEVDVSGGDPAGDEKKGKRVPYLLDVAVPQSDVTFVSQEAEDAYDYCVNAMLPTQEMLDYVFLGPLNGMPDEDGVVRRVPLVIGFRYTNKVTKQVRARFVPSFSFMVYLLHAGVEFPLKKGVVQVRMGREIVVKSRRFGQVAIPIDGKGRLYLNCEQGLKDFSRTSFADVAPARYSGAEVETWARKIAPVFKNRATVVAATGTGYDVGRCPLGGPVPLVLVHLTALDNMLRQHYLQPLAEKTGWLVLAVVFVVFVSVCLLERSSRLGIATVGAAVTYLLLALAGVYYNLVVLPVVTPMLYMVFCSFGVMTYRFFTEERAKRRIRGMFSSMVSDKVLAYLEESPDSFSLAGHATEATVFFSDVEQFTAISESLSPDLLTRFLNAYLTPVTNCILESGGYLDKYVGDGVMAVWGAPYRDPEHAVKACASALEQQRIVARLNHELSTAYGKTIRVRMGINSGHVTAGNMGSERKFQYTVMGDVVNIAARLEPVNKDFGTSIIIAEGTQTMVKDAFVTRPLSRVLVKGKKQIVGIYELIGEPGSVDEATMRVVEGYGEALQWFTERQWDKALARIDAVLAVKADDGPSLRLRGWLLECRVHPPPPTWQGEYVRAVKD